MRSVKIFSSYKSHFCCRLKHCFQKWFPVCAKNALFLAEAKFASREVQLNVNYISLARYKKHFWKQWLDNLYRSKTLTPAWKYSYFSGYARNEHERETDAGISFHPSHARSSPTVKKNLFCELKNNFWACMCAFKSNRVHVQRNFARTVQPATRAYLRTSNSATQQMFRVFTKFLLASVLKRVLVLNHSKRNAFFFYFHGGLALKPRQKATRKWSIVFVVTPTIISLCR